jgi:hypothetical protein
LVATPFAALGVEDGADQAFAVAESAGEFAATLRRLLQDDQECLRLMHGAASYARRWNRDQSVALRAALALPAAHANLNPASPLAVSCQ